MYYGAVTAVPPSCSPIFQYKFFSIFLYFASVFINIKICTKAPYNNVCTKSSVFFPFLPIFVLRIQYKCWQISIHIFGGYVLVTRVKYMLWCVYYWGRGKRKRKKKNCSPDVGLEPTTLRLRVSCSTDWANQAACFNYPQIILKICTTSYQCQGVNLHTCSWTVHQTLSVL